MGVNCVSIDDNHYSFREGLLDKLLSTAKENVNEREKESSDEPTTRRRKAAASPTRKETVPDYTSEQLESVKRIKRCKDYYEVLQVTKEATDTEIKKSYKKLALTLHPGPFVIFEGQNTDRA